MTSIQSHRCFCRKRISKGLSEFLFLPKSSYDKTLVNLPTVTLSKPPIAKYTEEDLQKIFKTVLEAQTPPFDGLCEKPLKAKSPDIYYSKSYIESYNFCQ